jgi:hypothetical protein
VHKAADSPLTRHFSSTHLGYERLAHVDGVIKANRAEIAYGQKLADALGELKSGASSSVLRGDDVGRIVVHFSSIRRKFLAAATLAGSEVVAKHESGTVEVCTFFSSAVVSRVGSLKVTQLDSQLAALLRSVVQCLGPDAPADVDLTKLGKAIEDRFCDKSIRSRPSTGKNDDTINPKVNTIHRVDGPDLGISRVGVLPGRWS